ncbi:uncharacterized protein METZ01_LOCUS396000, partial [marine metagenome]
LIIAEIISGADTIYAKAEDGIMTGLSKYRQFLGSILTMEGRYTDEKQEFLFRASVNGSIRVKTKNIQFSNNTTYTNSFINTSDPILSEVGIGYLYKIKNNSAIIMELYKKYPLNIPENASLFNVLPPEENSIHLGSFYQIRNKRVGLWNSVNIRGGAYLKELDFTGDKFLDYGATIGIGLEYFSNSQSIDFAFRAGKKESRIANGEYEKYISFHFGFTTGEKWFMKSRRK